MPPPDRRILLESYQDNASRPTSSINLHSDFTGELL
jgi:hypothetical protein